MFEGKAFEELKENIEEMMAEYTRSELDEMAQGLGINPSDYPNKRTLAYAVIGARELEKASQEKVLEEAPEEEAPEPVPGVQVEEEPFEETVQEVIQEEGVKVLQDTVKGKIRAFKEKTDEFNDYAPSLVARGREDLESGIAEFNRSIAAFNVSLESGIAEFNRSIAAFNVSIDEEKREFYKNVGSFQDAIAVLAEEYETYVKTNFKEGINALHQGTIEFKQSIPQQYLDSQKYIKNFYG